MQNNQLTDELEFQSKQTEKLLAKNKKLLENVTVLKREEEIHKKVETELAQRSQKAQNTINKLSEKVKNLEQERDKLKQDHKISEGRLPGLLRRGL